MYLDDPEPLVAVLADLAADGGVVSIAAKNAATLAVRPALAGDWKQALASFDATRQVNGLDVDTRADTVEGLSTMLVNHGWSWPPGTGCGCSPTAGASTVPPTTPTPKCSPSSWRPAAATPTAS